MKQITFILDLEIQGTIEEAEAFINNLSVPYTSQCDEPDTNSFEWFLDKSLKKAILLESFLDSDAACLRVNNLMQSPVNESFQQIFSVYDFKVLGEVNAALRNTLEGWKPSYLSYEAGFNKKI